MVLFIIILSHYGFKVSFTDGLCSVRGLALTVSNVSEIFPCFSISACLLFVCLGWPAVALMPLSAMSVSLCSVTVCFCKTTPTLAAGSEEAERSCTLTRCPEVLILIKCEKVLFLTAGYRGTFPISVHRATLHQTHHNSSIEKEKEKHCKTKNKIILIWFWTNSFLESTLRSFNHCMSCPTRENKTPLIFSNTFAYFHFLFMFSGVVTIAVYTFTGRSLVNLYLYVFTGGSILIYILTYGMTPPPSGKSSVRLKVHVNLNTCNRASN